MDQGLKKDDVDFDLTSWINAKLSALSPSSLNYGKKCIYEVQEEVKSNVPRVVSIGFLHHGKSQLEDMQEHKVKCLKHFLNTFQVTIEHLVEYIHGQQYLVCECYEDAIFRDLFERCKVKPSAVILLDGIFIIGLFLKSYFPGMREDGDILFNNSRVSNYVLNDLMLLENQLPLRFLRSLYDDFVAKQLSASGASTSLPTFDELVFEYFKKVSSSEKLMLQDPELVYSRHFVEFLSTVHMPGEKLPRVRPEVEKKLGQRGYRPRAADLKAAGVKFLKGANVRFDADKGELTIPQLTVNHFTVTFLRNLIAFEKSGWGSKQMTRYVLLLWSLMDRESDVTLLMDDGIIKNELGRINARKVLECVDSLYQEVKADLDEFLFVDVDYNELREYAQDRFHRWLLSVSTYFRMLERDYFNSPWIILNVSYLVIAFYIALIQTVFTVLQYQQK